MGDRGTRMLRALAARPTLAAALLFALLVVVYLWPVLSGEKVFAADAVLYKVAPWQPYRPADLASFENYLLADVPFEMHPWRELVRQLLHDGVLPAWNPHALTGVPLLSNPQTGLFSPFALPLWILPFHWALGLAAALKLWFAAMGTYLLVRELRLGFLAGLLAGVSFAFCAMNITWLTQEIVPAVIVLLPWMLWLIERLANGRGGIGSAIALAVVTAAALGGGHPGSQVHVLVAAGVYVLLRVAFARGDERPGRARALGLGLGGLVLGVALMGALMIPEILSSRGTVGTGAREGGHGSLPGLAEMPFGTIRTPLLPDWWGRPNRFETATSPLHSVNANYEERTFYAGAVALLIALMGLTTRARLRRQAPFLILGGLGLALALHAPGLWWLAGKIPPLSLVENQRLHFVFELAVAVLAGFGLQAVLDRPGERRRQLAVALAGIAVALLAAVLSSGSLSDAGRVVEHFATGRDFRLRGVVELTAVAWLLLFALGVTAALLALRRWPRRAAAIGAGLVLLASLDAFHFAYRWVPMAEERKAIPPSTPAIEYLQAHRGEGRFVGTELTLGPEQAIRFGIADVRGYVPPFPTQRYLDLWLLAAPDQVAWMPTTIAGISPAAVQVTGALGARFLVTDPGAGHPGRGDPALAPLRRVYAGEDATIFENPRATRRAFVARDVQVVPSGAAARATLAESGFDASRTVVVEEASAGGVRGTARIVEERNAGVTLQATLEERGLVVLADQLLDGWSVRVDGREAEPVRVNEVLRGVVVDAGEHEIEWSYRVPGLRAGVASSTVAALALLVAGLVARRRTRAPAR